MTQAICVSLPRIEHVGSKIAEKERELEKNAKIERETEAAKEQLEVATAGAKQLAEDLAGVTRKKEMHHDKARQFYAEAKAALAEKCIVCDGAGSVNFGACTARGGVQSEP